MKLFLSASGRREGSVLMVTLFSAVLIGTVLASYLTLIRQQSVAVARSQGWNAALAMAEAGVEEAMAQINAGVPWGTGWNASSNNYFQSRNLMGGSYGVRFFTNGPNPNPIIYSTGYVTIPSLSITVSRSITVTTKPTPVVSMGAVGARNNIGFSTGFLVTDSYDSADPANFGHYPAGNTLKQSTNGDVATVSGPISFGGGGTISIKGDVYLGPSVTAPAPGPVTGKIYQDYNADYLDVVAPVGAASWFPANVVGGKYTIAMSGSNLVSDGSLPIVVRPGVNAVIYVTASNFNPPNITVETNGFGSGKLKLYQQSGTANFPGSGSVAIQSERPEDFQYFGMSGVTSVTNTGNGNFCGVIYAPSANLIFNGGWNSGVGNRLNFIGAAIGKSVIMNGSYTFHFDENLLRPGVCGGSGMTTVSYVTDKWNENL